MFSSKRMTTRLGLFGSVAVFCATTMVASPARAAFHLWNLQELYSNSSGTLQFIELSTPNNGQTVVGGKSISVSNIGASLTNSFTIPANIAAPTAGKTLLFGTAGIQAAGGPAPDYILPNGFLFTAGGSINFFGANSGAYTALPTNGSASRIWSTGGNNTINSPRNYAGQTGVVVVPEPTSMILVSLALGSIYSMSRRRNLKSIAVPT